MAINVKKMKAKQPLFGANMPGSASNKKVMGPVDKSPVELNRSTDKLMKGTTTAGAGETPQEDSLVNKQSKEQGPNMAQLFTKGLRGETLPGRKSKPSAEDARLKKGSDMLAGKADLSGIEGEEKSPTYKDWREAGTASSTIVTAKKKVQAQF